MVATVVENLSKSLIIQHCQASYVKIKNETFLMIFSHCENLIYLLVSKE